jgi:hypothetical protein
MISSKNELKKPSVKVFSMTHLIFLTNEYQARYEIFIVLNGKPFSIFT